MASTAVIFDLDDTLYSEREYAFSGFEAVAATFEYVFGDPGELAADMRRLFDTEHRPRVFNALLTERNLPEDPALIRLMVELYRAHTPAIQLFPDADSALTRLRDRCKLGLITDGPTEQQWAKIDALDLRPRLDEILLTGELTGREGGDQVGQPETRAAGFGKPHPLAFEQMSHRLGVEPSLCAYVADNPAKDFIAPNALGWTTIRVLRADGIYRDRAAPEGGSAHHTIENLDAVDGLLPTGDS